MQIRVYYEDTDCGNVVYYANYLRFMERSRTELLRERGIELTDYLKRGILFVVTEAHAFYRSPAKYNDLLEVESTVDNITAGSMIFHTVMRRSGEETVLVKGEVRVACVNEAGRPVRIPEEVRRNLSVAKDNDIKK
jgi:acyl-CoA thioester hydrolase